MFNYLLHLKTHSVHLKHLKKVFHAEQILKRIFLWKTTFKRLIFTASFNYEEEQIFNFIPCKIPHIVT